MDTPTHDLGRVVCGGWQVHQGTADLGHACQCMADPRGQDSGANALTRSFAGK